MSASLPLFPAASDRAWGIFHFHGSLARLAMANGTKNLHALMHRKFRAFSATAFTHAQFVNFCTCTHMRSTNQKRESGLRFWIIPEVKTHGLC